MTINTLDSGAITTATKQMKRVKYFSMEITAASLLPKTNYSAYFNGTLVNAFCKPFGGTLGQQLISDSTGKMLFQFHMAIPYNKKYLVSNINSNTPKNAITLAQSRGTLQLLDPNGNATTTYFPINLKT